MQSTSLSEAAYDVADAYRSDRWPGLKDQPWERVWMFLVRELKRRCPGHPKEEYDRALDRGFIDSR